MWESAKWLGVFDNGWNTVIAAVVATVVGFALWAVWPKITHQHRRHKFIVGLIRQLAADPDAQVFRGHGPEADSLQWWNSQVHDRATQAGRNSYAYCWIRVSGLCEVTKGRGYLFWPTTALARKWARHTPVLIIYCAGKQGTRKWFFVDFDGAADTLVQTDTPYELDALKIHRLGGAKLFPPER